MDTFQLSVYNFIDQIHYSLRLKYSETITYEHLRQYTSSDLSNVRLNVSARGIARSFVTKDSALKYANDNKAAQHIVIFIHEDSVYFGCSTITHPSDLKLSVVINRDIQFFVNVTKLPLTFETLIGLISQKLKVNAMTVDWRLELDTEASQVPESGIRFRREESWFSREDQFSNSDFMTTIEAVNSDLKQFGEAKVFLKFSSSNSNKRGEDNSVSDPDGVTENSDSFPEGKIQTTPQEKVVCTKETLNQLVEGIEKLETSIGKSLKNDVFVNIPLQDEELFEFYDKIKTEEQLVELKHSYEKYQQWLTLYGSDENKVEAHLIKQNDVANDIMNNSINPQITSDECLKDSLRLKIFFLDRNICFKFTNGQTTALPSGLVLKVDYTGLNFLGTQTISIDLVHGVGSLSTKTFTRFKHEIGNSFDIENITRVQILQPGENNGTVLYTGKSDFYREEKEDKPVKFFNFEAVKIGAKSEPSIPNDIISTDINTSQGSTWDAIEYDVLSQPESESFY